MKLSRSRFRVYLDIALFIIISLSTIIAMIIGVFTNNHIIEPARFFTIVYLSNLIFYRLCTELENFTFNKPHKLELQDFLSLLYTLCIVSSISLIIYLSYFSIQIFWHCTLRYMLSNHVFYATIVGCLFTVHLVFDNTAILYNTYFKKYNKEEI